MKRIAQLDGVRGVAILMVLVWHYCYCQIETVPHSLGGKVAQLVILTWSGVDLFFVLSGFLIAGILLDHRDASNFFQVFYFRRVCRIFPLYYGLVASFTLLTAVSLSRDPSFQWLFRDPMPIWSYATFSQNIFMGIRGTEGANWLNMTWSLAVEEQFYLFIPFLIYFLPRRKLVGVLVIAILAAPFLRWISPGFHAFVDTPWRSDSLMSGALLALFVRTPSLIAAVDRHRTQVLTLFAVLLAGAALMTAYPGCFGPFDHLWLAVLYSTFVLLAFIRTWPILNRVLGARLLVWFGELSYGIYMFHQPISGLLHGILEHRAPVIRTPHDAAITLAALVITMVIAAFSFRFFQTPLLRIGRRAKYLQLPVGNRNPAIDVKEASSRHEAFLSQ